MAFFGKRYTAIAPTSLPGQVSGPFVRFPIVYLPSIFQLMTTTMSTFQLAAAQAATFQLIAWQRDVFQLEV